MSIPVTYSLLAGNHLMPAKILLSRSCMSFLTTRVRRRWRVVVNPYAHIPVPDCLLTGIESVDESEAHGLQCRRRA